MGFIKKHFENQGITENSNNTQQDETQNSIDLNTATIEEISHKLTEKTAEGLAAIEEIKGTMEQIAAAAEENAGAAEESLSAIEEINKNAQTLENDSNFILEISEKFMELIKGANQSILEDKEKMRVTANFAEEIAKKANLLYDSSKEIDNAVNLITKLAKKTSLLALNAAIEAARAKEKGKSFTIMASEIRQIASKSNRYVVNIKEIVQITQEKIAVAKDVMNTLHTSMQEAEKIALDSSNNMYSIMNLIKKTNELTMSIVDAVKRTAKEVSAMHQSAEIIASAAEESASAVSEITNTISQQVEAFAQAEVAAKMIKDLIDKMEGGDKKAVVDELASASEELTSTNEEIERSMEQTVEALEQIEEAANIAKEDAKRAEEITIKTLQEASHAKDLLNNLFEDLKKIDQIFDSVIQDLKRIKAMALENTKSSEDIIPSLDFINSKINALNDMIRKIELSIVQISALSINGSVEAIRAGEFGSGFSEVSRDIKELANSSEENLDKVIQTINKVKEENDQINVLVNNIILTQRAENEKLDRIEYELANNKENLTKVLEAVEKGVTLVENIVQALEQSKIAAEQILEAGELSHKNAAESKEAANIILQISRDMKELSAKLYEIASALAGEA
ncbi:MULTISPECIES: methyl-accepting chemotaxis protein [unclassified Nitratiruptor]|uniref:methyl-accepting chemotaxis protein n=1 Tax=unclassified Nitratiruptor TaxID=2624044 RepID=UPI0019165467|nr:MULTISPECIES: methyl-accepting chemotaxis protein [unclassified Nitratiruptor]BCD60074.1 methyl-accepting chemotaxis protein [Nitratiruptor sp. YY08-10]BCD64437.1 methyl-accepting chemotaxis protein [Nitratiruptor sp. YY08-14]